MAITSPPAPDPSSVIPALPAPLTSTGRGARTPWWMWLTILGLAIVAIVATAIVGRPPTTSIGIPAERFLPADGTAWILEAGDQKFVVESAWETGVRYALQTPGLAAEELIHEVEEAVGDPVTAHFWRRTITELSGDLPQVTQVFLVSDQGVSLLAATGGRQSFTYRPGLMLLPANPEAGASWAQSGAALPRDILGYIANVEITGVTDGCLALEETLQYTDPSTEQVLSSGATSSRICPGIGPTVTSDVTDGIATEQRMTVFSERPLDVSFESPEIVWGSPDEWQSTPVGLWVDDSTFGRWEAYDIPDGPAAATASGVLVLTYGADAVGYRVAEGEATREWIAHPGGTIVSAATIGDAVLLATSKRELVAYDDRGRRAWVASFPDALRAAPVSDGSGGAIAISLDGTVARLDLTTGDNKWRVSPGVGAIIDPVVDDTAVYYVDRDGTVFALDLATGETLWSTPLVTSGTFLVADGEGVLVGVSNGTVLRFDASDGTELGRIDAPGLPRGAALVGDDGLLVWSDGGITAHAPNGQRVHHLPDFTAGLIGDGRVALALSPSGAAVVLGEDGEELARFTTEFRALGVTYGLVPHGAGAWLIGSDNTVVGIGLP